MYGTLILDIAFLLILVVWGEGEAGRGEGENDHSSRYHSRRRAQKPRVKIPPFWGFESWGNVDHIF